MATDADNLLAVRDLAVKYTGREHETYALSGVSFDVGARDSWGIVGETGCGKSTLVRALIGLLPPSARITGGSVEYRGRDLLQVSSRELRRVRGTEIAFMPQNSFSALNPVVKIEDQFRNVIRQRSPRLSAKDCRALADRWLRDAGIVDPGRVLDGYAHHLSGGMAQRVVIAMTMIREPVIVIADEPTTGLDLTILRQIMDLFVQMRDERGCSTIVVTHALGVVANYCTRMVVMYAGQIVELGPVADVLTRPHHPYTRALIGAVPRRDHGLAIIPGTVPSLHEPPVGCVFKARCALRLDPRCEIERPPLREVAPGHLVATFYDSTSHRVPVAAAT